MNALGGLAQDYHAVRRCFGTVVPTALAARRTSRELNASFDVHIAPLLRQTVAEKTDRENLTECLRPWAIQGGFLVDAYARLATGHGAAELGTLAAVFTRLYDDLLDEAADESYGERIGGLFAGREFHPASDQERFLERVYRSIESLAPRAGHEASYRALLDLHRWQLRSRIQVGKPLTHSDLWELTCTKGGLAMVVLGGLVQPSLTDAEARMLHQLGSLLQLVDDFQDRGVDRLHGIHTLATSGALGFGELTRRLHLLEQEWRTTYDPKSIKPFFDELTLWVYFVGLIRLVRGKWSTPAKMGNVGRTLTRRFVICRKEAIR